MENDDQIWRAQSFWGWKHHLDEFHDVLRPPWNTQGLPSCFRLWIGWCLLVKCPFKTSTDLVETPWPGILILKKYVPTKKLWAVTAKSQLFQVRFSTPLHRKRSRDWLWTNRERPFLGVSTTLGPGCMTPRVPWGRNKKAHCLLGDWHSDTATQRYIKPWGHTMHTQFAGATGS